VPTTSDPVAKWRPAGRAEDRPDADPAHRHGRRVGTCRGGARSRPALVALLPVVVLLASCGTRLPDKAFTTTTTPGSTPSTTGSVVANPASDTGVSADEIKVGVVVSLTGPLGAEAFSGPMYGALAYFEGLNARGGINGRRVTPVVCDDGSSGSGNQRCVQDLIERDQVFAFAGNSIFTYAGAGYVNDKGVPDIGGQPIGHEYDQYPLLYSIYGSSAPREGTVGFDGKLYGGTEVYRYFRTKLKTKVAAVVAYNQSDSLRFADYTEKGLRREGYDVVREQVDFGVPNWDAAVIDMKARGVDIVFDALENTGNVNLCRAMDRNGLDVRAKVMSVQSWTDTVRSQYSDSPTCRKSLYATANDLNYADTQHHAVARFRKDMARTYPEREEQISMWAVEGWASAQWFTDAAESCGADLTRACLEAYMGRPDPYDGHGLLTPRGFVVSTDPEAPTRNCLNVARWQDAAQGGRGGWVTQTPNMDDTCFLVPSIAYAP